MPIYEYHCDDCDKDFEYLVFGSDKPVCPTCDGQEVKKLMSAGTFFSKGSSGETVKMPAGSSSCGGCAGTSCATCH